MAGSRGWRGSPPHRAPPGRRRRRPPPPRPRRPRRPRRSARYRAAATSASPIAAPDPSPVHGVPGPTGPRGQIGRPAADQRPRPHQRKGPNLAGREEPRLPSTGLAMRRPRPRLEDVPARGIDGRGVPAVELRLAELPDARGHASLPASFPPSPRRAVCPAGSTCCPRPRTLRPPSRRLGARGGAAQRGPSPAGPPRRSSSRTGPGRGPTPRRSAISRPPKPVLKCAIPGWARPHRS